MSVSGPELTPVQGAEGHPLLVDTCLWVPSLWGPRALALNGAGVVSNGPLGHSGAGLRPARAPPLPSSTTRTVSGPPQATASYDSMIQPQSYDYNQL